MLAQQQKGPGNVLDDILNKAAKDDKKTPPAKAGDGKKAIPPKKDDKKAPVDPKDNKKTTKDDKKSKNPVDDLLKGIGKDGKKGKDKVDVKSAPKVKGLQYGISFVGTLNNISNSNELVINVEYQIQVPDPNGPKRVYDWQLDLARRQYDISRQQNPFTRQQQIAEYMQKANSPPSIYNIQTKNKNVTVRTGQEMKVRIPPILVPPQFDDKGNRKKLTKEDIRKLKGDPNLPGFVGTLTDLQPGQLIQVYLARPTPKAAPKKTAPNATDIVGGGENAVDATNTYPEAVMIMIVRPSQQQ